MAGLGVVDPHSEPVIGVAGLVALPVCAFHQAVGLVVDECAGFFLPGLRHAVAALVVGVGVVLVLGAAAYQPLQLTVDVDMRTSIRLVGDISHLFLLFYTGTLILMKCKKMAFGI